MNLLLFSFLIISVCSLSVPYKPCPHLAIDQFPLCFMVDGACACYDSVPLKKKRAVYDEPCIAPFCDLNPPPGDPDCPKPYCFRIKGRCACEKK